MWRDSGRENVSCYLDAELVTAPVHRSRDSTTCGCWHELDATRMFLLDPKLSARLRSYFSSVHLPQVRPYAVVPSSGDACWRRRRQGRGTRRGVRVQVRPPFHTDYNKRLASPPFDVTRDSPASCARQPWSSLHVFCFALSVRRARYARESIAAHQAIWRRLRRVKRRPPSSPPEQLSNCSDSHEAGTS